MEDIEYKRSEYVTKQRKLAEKSFYHFVCCIWPTIVTEKMVPNWHIVKLCQEMQIVMERVIERKPKLYDLVINVPPGSTKSTIISQAAPAWMWIKDQSIRALTGSHSMDLSSKHAAKTKKIIKSDLFRLLWKDLITLDRDQERYYTTTKGGERICCSVGSGIIGNHAHIHIIDDPIDPEKALSETALTKANRWFTATISSRKTDPKITPLILVMQRLEEFDPSGYILETYPKVRHLCFPAEDKYPIKPPEYKKYYRNGLMDPKRKGLPELDEERKIKSSREYAAQYGQSPMDTEGNIVKRHMLKVISRFNLPDEVYQLPFKFWGDMAYTEDEENDPSGILATKTYQNVLYVFDFEKFWEEFDGAIKEVKGFMAAKDSLYEAFEVENKASGMSIAQNLRSTHGLNAIDYKHEGSDKPARLKFNLKYIESGRVVFVKGSYWTSFKQNLLAFPSAKHDEEVDTLVMAITKELAEPQRHGQRRMRAFKRV